MALLAAGSSGVVADNSGQAIGDGSSSEDGVA
jgi:hypothetical protein